MPITPTFVYIISGLYDFATFNNLVFAKTFKNQLNPAVANKATAFLMNLLADIHKIYRGTIIL